MLPSARPFTDPASDMLPARRPDAVWQSPDPHDLPPTETAEQIAAHGRNLAALGLIHLRHDAAPRAMVLGLAAMAMGDTRPRTVLMVAEALLQAGDPAQAEAALDRFDAPPGDPAGLSPPPTGAETAARHYLLARILLRQDRPAEARAALDLALEAAP